MIYSSMMKAKFKGFSLNSRLSRLTIFQRIAIGNSVVIAIGAIGGTLITRMLTDKAADIWLIILFTIVWTIFSVLINSLIVSSALRPLY